MAYNLFISLGIQLLQKHTAAGALHNSGEVSEQPKCHPGTRVAILEHLLAWATALTYTYPIIWLHGPAGAGKSAILRTIAEMLYNRQLLLASFFFFRTAPGRNNSDNFIPTIAYQLNKNTSSAIRSHIADAIERDPLIFSLSLWDQAQALIVSPILAHCHDPSFDRSPRIIIVDGLDECRDPEKQCEILQVLCRVIQELPISIAILVASRPEHHIRDTFDFGELNKLSSRLSLDNCYEPDADIERYLKDRFDMIRTSHPQRSILPSPWPTKEIMDKLVAKASGQFIYASTVDKFVSSNRYNPTKRLNIILGTIDAGALKPFEQLDILYSTIFLTINPEDLDRTLRLLGVLLVPLQPELPDITLSTTFLPLRSVWSPQIVEGLLELEPGDVRTLLFDLESLLTVGGDNEEIRFFHASLSDYLFDRSRSGNFWIDAGMVYTDLAQQCLCVLFKSNPGEYLFEGHLYLIIFNNSIFIVVVREFCYHNGGLFFLKATPTPCLDKAIKKHHSEYSKLMKYVCEFLSCHLTIS